MGGSREAWLCPEPGGLQEQPLGTMFSLSEPQHSRLERALCQNLDNIGQSLKWIVFGPAIALLGLYPRRTRAFAQEHSVQGFPGGAVVESLPDNAGVTGSSPGLGRSHMPRSSWAREPQLLSLRVWSLCSATREAAVVRGPRTAMKSGPRLPQLEKALA